MLNKTGVPTSEDLVKVTPSAERLSRGPVAVIECFQQIPCNPCATSCPRGAISSFNDINDLPEIDHDRCNGCAICVANCPGLAIFVVDESYTDTTAVVKIPYEFLPVPEAGQAVTALDREGHAVGTAIVVRVQNSKQQDRTLVVWLEIAKELAMTVRHFRMEG
ncbi:MAG: 4Fe-4S dicluster domain-containing protein [Bacillota bacterium]